MIYQKLNELKNDIKKQEIKIGSDKFYKFLRSHKLLDLKNYYATANSKRHFYKYKNLITPKILTRTEQL